MDRRYRLSSSADFQRVRRMGKVYAHPLVILITCPNGLDVSRFGVTAGRRVGGAVDRNRAKRLLREAVRPYVTRTHPGWDIVLIARSGLLTAAADMTRCPRRPMRRTDQSGPRLAILLTVALSSLTLAGCSEAAGAANSWPGLSAGDQVIYVSFNAAVHAIDPASGAARWRFPAEAQRNVTFFAAPTPTDDGHVIVGGYDNRVYSLNAEDGGVAWTFEGVERIDLVIVAS